LKIRETKRNPSAAKVYAEEVKTLKGKLAEAQKNKPKENKAQILANQTIAAKFRDNRDMDEDTKKKIKGQAITAARAKMGASKPKVTFTQREWEAVQAGAIGSTNLKKLLNNADLDQVKQLAMPRSSKTTISSAQISRMRAMSSSGYTIQEIAEVLGVSPSSVSKNLK
jgi:DNA-binding CsgD family transcriptional regulator